MRAPQRRRQIRFRQSNKAALDAEQTADCRGLNGRRHATSAARNTKNNKTEAPGPGQNGGAKALVPRHVDEPEHQAVGRRQVGEAEIDRDPPLLLLLEPVGVDARERAHQRGLAVIDMARRADHHGPTSGNGMAARRSASAMPSASSAARAAARNGAASALPLACARSSQARPATGSRTTPDPIAQAAPSMA